MEPTSSVTTPVIDLCKKTSQKLGKDYLSEPLRNELKQVNGELADATKEYLKYKFIADCVKKFLDQNVEEKVKNKGRTILSDPFYLNIVKEYSTEGGLQPFGITEDLINKTIKKKQKTQEEKDKLNKFIKDEVSNFCVKISKYTGCAQRYTKAYPRRAFDESVKELSSQLNGLAAAKCQLEAEEEEINNLVTNYFENLMEGIWMLKSLISLHEKKLEFHSSLRDRFVSRQRTMSSKINRFEYQVLVATYHKKSIEALYNIRTELDEKRITLDNEINSTNGKLQQYLLLGPQYNSLVEEYTELLKKIQDQKWAIESFKQRPSFGGSLSDKEELIKNFERDHANNSNLDETENSVFLKETVNGTIIQETADDSRRGETAYDSRHGEETDDSRLEEEADDSREEEAADDSRQEEAADDSRQEEAADDSRQEEAADDSRLKEGANDSRLEEANDSRLKEGADDSILEKIVEGSTSTLKETDEGSTLEEISVSSKLEQTVEDSMIEGIIFSSTLRETIDCSTLDERVDNSILDTTQKDIVK